MAKQTRKDKIAAGDKKPEAKQQRARVEKPKGPAPASYAPNRKHAEEIQRQAFAKKIADTKPETADFVCGKEGKFLVGYTSGNYTEGHYLDVITKDVAEKDGKAGYTITLIQGDVSAHSDGDPVTIPHPWIFSTIEELERKNKFAKGYYGEIQRGMHSFIRQACSNEIAEEKYRRNQIAAAKAAAQEGSHITLATSGGKKPTAGQQGKLKLSSLSNFGPGMFNRYDFGDVKNRHCVVEYTNESGTNVLRIHSMHAEHELAIAGVKVGLTLCAVHLNKSCAIPAPETTGEEVEVYKHLCLFRGFLLQSLEILKEKQQKAA